MDPLVECTIPVLPVKDLANSLAFYTETLGFKVDWKGGVVAGVSRDGQPIMLSEMHGPKKPTWVWIGITNASWFEELPQKGVKVHQKPSNQVWAYEMKVEDIDGNILWLGTTPRRDIPFDE